MSNLNEESSESESSVPVSYQKMGHQLVLHPNNRPCEHHNQLEINIQLFENIKLKHLINQFEAVFKRVKQLELNHLLQPVQIATFKLKELQKITEVLACDYYNDYPCADKSCCNDIDLTKARNDNEKRLRSNDAFDESCECLDTRCEKACHCSSNEGESDQNKKIITAGEPVESCCEKKSTSGMKCNPCRCSYDASGKKVKTLECRLASRAKKLKRNEAEMIELRNAAKLKKDEIKLALRRSESNVLAERKISNTKIEIQTNLTNFKLNLKKENTTIQDITYQNPRERNQAVSCNLSSESSTEEYFSDSSDQVRYSKHPGNNRASPRIPPRLPNESSTDEYMHSQVECCGCGQGIETTKVGASKTCPCGCGDVESLSDGEYVDIRCDSCGVSMQSLLPQNKNINQNACNASGNQNACNTLRNGSFKKQQQQEICLSALTRF